MKLLKTLFTFGLAQSALAAHATGTSENTDGILADEDRKQVFMSKFSCRFRQDSGPE